MHLLNYTIFNTFSLIEWMMMYSNYFIICPTRDMCIPYRNIYFCEWYTYLYHRIHYINIITHNWMWWILDRLVSRLHWCFAQKPQTAPVIPTKSPTPLIVNSCTYSCSIPFFGFSRLVLEWMKINETIR